MRASSGDHFVALDHVRALAIYLVLVWHFTHGTQGWPVPFEYNPSLFWLAPFEEGHTGVALFMVLSGYLFARLIADKEVHWPSFLWNRALRLLPLLFVVIAVVAAQRYFKGEPVLPLMREVAWGWLKPTLPQGGWSITVEFHFYVLLPLLLWLGRRHPGWWLLVLAAALSGRVWLFQRDGTVQWWSYLTLVGRIDQFVLGMLACSLRAHLARRHLLAAAVGMGFSAFYSGFNFTGGYFALTGFPSSSAVWVVLPLVEGLAFATLVGWYDASFQPPNRGVSGWVARLGDYSYAIYLLHFFFVFATARWVHQHIWPLENFGVALFAATCFAVLMMPFGHLARVAVELPAMRWRRAYLNTAAAL